MSARKNHLRKGNNCGTLLPESRASDLKRTRETARGYRTSDNAACRKRIQDAIVAAYESELERSKLPGYKPVDLDDYDYGSDAEWPPFRVMRCRGCLRWINTRRSVTPGAFSRRRGIPQGLGYGGIEIAFTSYSP